MVTKNLAEELYSNSYPGRGIVLGRSADGKHAVIAYFIMGRSENSRNRVFVQDGARRYFFDYDAPRAGEGHFIHTYEGDGNPLPSFEGEPTQVKLEGDIDAFTAMVWNALNADNKVSLFTRYIDLATGETETRIVNKNQE